MEEERRESLTMLPLGGGFGFLRREGKLTEVGDD